VKSDVIRPVLQALVLTERVYTDISGMKIIAGTFNEITTQKIVTPQVERRADGSSVSMLQGGTDPGCPSLYISLTEVESGTELAIQFVNAKESKVIFQMALKIENADRVGTVEIVAPLPPMAKLAREPGVFSFDVMWNGEILGSHRMTVTTKE